jgi:hypothetical protein
MRKLLPLLCLAICCTSFPIVASAQANHAAWPESRADRKARKKFDKAMKKSLKKQIKKQNKMYKDSVKKTHLPKHNYSF